MRDRRRVDELSIEELERILAIRKREARRQRLRRQRKSGRVLPHDENADSGAPPEPLADPIAERNQPKPLGRRIAGAGLLFLEIAIVFGLLYIGLNTFGLWQRINTEAQAAFQGSSPNTPVPTAVISAVVLPGGHTPPDEFGNSEFNLGEIPEHLRPLVNTSVPAVAIPTPSPEQATHLTVPSLGINGAPIVQGDGWEQLKLGVGQHIGTANPGQPGNIVLSAHNDIFGELFRHLDQLTAGDTFTIHTATSDYTYIVTGRDIVDPIQGVYVMNPTREPTATLISCYPYLVNTERIVVFAELVSN